MARQNFFFFFGLLLKKFTHHCPNASHVVCLKEHHLRTEEIRNVNFSQYNLGAFVSVDKHIDMKVYVFLFLRISSSILLI